MADELPPLLNEDATRSLADDVRQLVEDGRTLVEAEIAYQSSRAKVFGGRFGRIVGMGALALALVFFALMALTCGLVIALAGPLGPWLATAVVTVGLLALAGLFAFTAKRGWIRLTRLIADEKGEAP